MKRFQKELESLINRHSVDNKLATPDFILAEFVVSVLTTMEATTMRRERWFGRSNKAPEFLADNPGTTTGRVSMNEKSAAQEQADSHSGSDIGNQPDEPDGSIEKPFPPDQC